MGQTMQRLFMLSLFTLLYSTPLYAKTWAAQLTYGAGELSPVFHAKSQDGVLTRAGKFCEQNDLCRSEFDSADLQTTLATGVVGRSQLFVTTACRQDNGDDLYTIAATSYDEDRGRNDGKEKALARIKAAGFLADDCHIHAVFGVKSQKQLWTGQPSAQPKADPIKTRAEVRLWRLQRRNAIRTTREVLSAP
jgi:hypothetical protein